MTYSVVFVFGVQPSDSVIHILTVYLLFSDSFAIEVIAEG